MRSPTAHIPDPRPDPRPDLPPTPLEEEAESEFVFLSTSLHLNPLDLLTHLSSLSPLTRLLSTLPDPSLYQVKRCGACGKVSVYVSGERLRKMRESVALPMRVIAERSGYAIGHLSKIECGKRNPPEGIEDVYERAVGERRDKWGS